MDISGNQRKVWGSESNLHGTIGPSIQRLRHLIRLSEKELGSSTTPAYSLAQDATACSPAKFIVLSFLLSLKLRYVQICNFFDFISVLFLYGAWY